jgi:dihydroorotase
MNELLKQVRVLDPEPGIDQTADVLMSNGILQAIETEITDLPAETQVREGRGLVLGPGLVDLYSHSGEPGHEDRETLESLMQAAAAGGFTRIALLPDTVPVLDHAAGLTWFQQRVPQLHIPVSLSLWGALTVGLQGQQMSELAELADAGVVGFTDGQPISNLALVRRLLEYLQPFGKPVALWPCSRQLAGPGMVREGPDSIRLGLAGNPAFAETSALAALLEVVEAVGTPVHLMRISTARSVELIAQAKQRKVPVTASTTWMHLIADTTALNSYNPNFRLDPPLGNPSDRLALIQGIREGVIDTIAIDHTPYSYEEKTVAFGEAPPGAIGLELALPLLWQTLVETGEWPALKLWQVLSTSACHCLQQKPASLTVGKPVELTLFDPHQSWTPSRQTLKSRATNTPWLGLQLVGRVLQTWNAAIS